MHPSPGRVHRFLVVLGLLVPLACASTAPAAEERPEATGRNAKITLSGVGWITYRYALSYADSAQTHYLPASIERAGENSFDIDRVYLTADYAFNDRYSWQSQIEIQNVSGEPTMFVKKAFLRVKTPFGIDQTSFRFGQIGNVYTPVVEDLWGYRIVSKVPVDRYMGVSTTWVGAGFDGTLLDGVLGFDAAVADQHAYNRPPSMPKYKTGQARLTLRPMPQDPTLKGLQLTGFWQLTPDAPPASKNNTIWFGGLLDYKVEKVTAGVEFDERQIRSDNPANIRTSRYYGGFVSLDLSSLPPAPFRGARIFGRLDRFDPDTRPGKSHDGATTVFAGLSREYLKGIRSIVDLEYTRFDDLATSSGGAFPPGRDKDLTLSARMEVTL